MTCHGSSRRAKITTGMPKRPQSSWSGVSPQKSKVKNQHTHAYTCPHSNSESFNDRYWKILKITHNTMKINNKYIYILASVTVKSSRCWPSGTTLQKATVCRSDFIQDKNTWASSSNIMTHNTCYYGFKWSALVDHKAPVSAIHSSPRGREARVYGIPPKSLQLLHSAASGPPKSKPFLAFNPFSSIVCVKLHMNESMTLRWEHIQERWEPFIPPPRHLEDIPWFSV